MTNLRKSFVSFLIALMSLSFLWPQPVKAYEHRSVLLDCARKYYSVDWIKQLIDLMEENKANELLFHFSENEGMRIESKQYPWLTQGEKGVYTQEDILELGAYAKEKGIELIPSFDSPDICVTCLIAINSITAIRSQPSFLINASILPIRKL